MQGTVLSLLLVATVLLQSALRLKMSVQKHVISKRDIVRYLKARTHDSQLFNIKEITDNKLIASDGILFYVCHYDQILMQLI